MASSILPVACNRPRTVAVASAVSSLVGLGVAALLIREYGVAAVPLGLIVGEALACYVFVPRESCRLIGEDYRRFTLHQVVGLGVGALLAFAAGWAVARIAVGPLVVQWLEVGAATLAASLLAAWAVGLESDERWLLLGKGRASLVRLGLLPAAQDA
jgi:uncharacterized membrane protein (Fun14 family)